MRTKEKILDDILLLIKISDKKDKAMIENSYYQVEVLIDIRDSISTIINAFLSLREHLQRNL